MIHKNNHIMINVVSKFIEFLDSSLRLYYILLILRREMKVIYNLVRVDVIITV